MYLEELPNWVRESERWEFTTKDYASGLGADNFASFRSEYGLGDGEISYFTVDLTVIENCPTDEATISF